MKKKFIRIISSVLLIQFCLSNINAQNYNNLINYNYGGTPTYGVKIKTNLPFTPFTQMPTITITGYNLGSGETIALQLVYYIYDGGSGNFFADANISSYGQFAPPVYLAGENGKVVIFMDDREYYQRFTVSAFAIGMSQDNVSTNYQNWTAVDEALVSPGTATLLSYKNSFTGNVLLPNSGIWKNNGTVGIGTRSPQANLDIAQPLSSGQLSSVFGRLNEGNSTGSGTFLGVRGYDTQGSDPSNVKSFAIEHSFYGVTNSSINFYRGGNTTGGFLSFNTYNNSERMRITGSGSVGIGTTAPTDIFEVAKSATSKIKFFTPSTYTYPTDFGTGVIGMALTRSDGLYTNGLYSYTSIDGSRDNLALGSRSDIVFLAGQNGLGLQPETLRIKDDGTVGIGTSDTKGNKLAVNGSAIFTKAIVRVYPWADYVFDENYKIPKLPELETFIKINHHLPDVPSAKEVEKEGIDLGSNQALLLKKIEELTLILIEQNKHLSSLEKVVEEQQQELKSLKK